jgi:quinol monooxygenase YgiN
LSSYQLKIEIKENKIDEFVSFLTSMLGELRIEEGCLDYSLYRDMEKENIYGVIAEWTDKKSMDGHFMKKNFSLLVGAAEVLGENFELIIYEISEKGSSQLAREKIELQTQKNK